MPASGWASATQTAELTASDGAAGDELGWSVATWGDTVLAGAYGHEVAANASQGSAYVFLAPLPSVEIVSPVNGATYTQGQAVAAGYSCSAPAPASVTACTGSVANGAAIDTTTLGEHTFIANTTESEGLSASQSASYTVVAGPVVSSLSETAKIWREGNALARIAAEEGSERKASGRYDLLLRSQRAGERHVHVHPPGQRTQGRQDVRGTDQQERERASLQPHRHRRHAEVPCAHGSEQGALRGPELQRARSWRPAATRS